MPEVISVNKSMDPLNPAAMTDVIEKLVAAKYGSPDWTRQGPNFIANKVTGQVINLNQEATSILEDAPVRQDAIAVVKTDSGDHQIIWVDQTALQAAGGDLQVLKKNLNETLSPGLTPMTWALILGGGAFIYWMAKK